MYERFVRRCYPTVPGVAKLYKSDWTGAPGLHTARLMWLPVQVTVTRCELPLGARLYPGMASATPQFRVVFATIARRARFENFPRGKELALPRAWLYRAIFAYLGSITINCAQNGGGDDNRRNCFCRSRKCSIDRITSWNLIGVTEDGTVVSFWHIATVPKYGIWYNCKL